MLAADSWFQTCVSRRVSLEEMPKLKGHLVCRRVPLAGALGQRFQADPIQFLRHVVVNPARGLGFPRGDLFQQVCLALARERPPARQQLIKDRAEAVNVASAIDPMAFTTSLFGAHVEWCPGEAWAMTEVLVP